jgi:hypothetical protein
MDLKYALGSLGVTIDGPAWMHGVNQSEITSSTILHSTLKKQQHSALSSHKVREAITSNLMYFLHVPGIYNPADGLMKVLPWITLWPCVQPILFWKGETVKA